MLRRNPLELWGAPAYRDLILPGRFLGRQQVLLNDPVAIRHVLLGNQENYRRNAPAKRVLGPVLGDGLFLAEGEAWRHQRRVIAPALAPRVMPVLARHVVSVSERFEREIESAAGRPIVLIEWLQRLALDVAGQSMFSLEMGAFGAELRGLLIRYARDFAKVGLLDMVLPADWTTPLDRGRARFRADWLALMDRIIDARSLLPAPGPEQPRDLFDLLRDARDPETGQGFDHALLRDEVSTLILAGHETTAVTLFWACYAAASLPEMQERIAAEAAVVDLDGEGAGKAASSLPYTRAFIDEALRLYPPAYLLVREAKAADRLGDLAIEPGTIVSISPWVLHRHEAHWGDPDRFDPARFLPGAAPPDRMVYIPFGAGPRICVGAQFALTEAVLVLARLVRRFRLSLPEGGTVLPRALVTTQPDRPVRFRLAPRRH
ncbi:cytochrome P450 [Acetobacteraceae bacterium KSS8]|uniref:Cytochrome P450 n=1 Tax=Endosaccharibacter trunci TaxID=2812733 RepID=A0ABT1W6B3_9PROT|nr:cytochrome P450 [Acetobacteraceae bacterium KSS8]